MMNLLTSIIPENHLSVPDFRDWICSIEDKMSAMKCSVDRHDESSGIKTEHTFTPGLYTRQIFMPAGSLVISRIHMWEHPYIISQGLVHVYDGDEIVSLKAPHQGVTKPGTKRLLYVEKDTIWTTFHVTDKMTLEEVDADGVVTCGSFDEFERLVNKELPL